MREKIGGPQAFNIVPPLNYSMEFAWLCNSSIQFLFIIRRGVPFFRVPLLFHSRCAFSFTDLRCLPSLFLSMPTSRCSCRTGLEHAIYPSDKTAEGNHVFLRKLLP